MKSKFEIITEQVKALSEKMSELTKLMEEAEIGNSSWWDVVDSKIAEIERDWMEIEL